MSRNNQPPISISRIVKHALKNKNKIIVVIGKILNDERFYPIPKLNICALRVSESVKTRILDAGGKIFTFDELAIRFPNGKDLILLRGKKNKKKKNVKYKKTI
jgi:large subunit ribosomal protein L18e